MAATTAPESSRDAPANVEIVPDDGPYSGPEPALVTETEMSSSTESLLSSVLKLSIRYENGRRYHAYREGEYPLPNDDREQDRLDLHHHVFRLAVGGALFRAPIDPTSARILDLGTGTGIWAIEMADEYPSANVTGNDLSPIQPHWVPPNCFLEVDDIEPDWDFSKPFDFIHGRNLAGSVQDFPCLYRRIMDNLKPGGWVEMVDFAGDSFFSDDGTLERAPNLVDWITFQCKASAKFGKEFDVARHHKQWMIDAGFKNVKEEVHRVPLNPWPKDLKMKELGRYQEANVIESMESYSLALFTRVLGWSAEEVLAFFTGVRKELTDRSLHVYTKFYYVWGEKK